MEVPFSPDDVSDGVNSVNASQKIGDENLTDANLSDSSNDDLSRAEDSLQVSSNKPVIDSLFNNHVNVTSGSAACVNYMSSVSQINSSNELKTPIKSRI